MKRTLWIGGLSLLLVACANDGGQQDNASAGDSAGHQAHGGVGTAHDAGAAPGGDSASMMSLMHGNMEQMQSLRSTGNPDQDFASLMKVHHMGALEMARLQVARGNDPELKQMAQQMISEQQQEITAFDAFLSNNKAQESGGDAFFRESMKQMDDMQMDMSQSGSVDQQFARLMIPHHQGAIDMAQAYLRSGAQDAKLKSMAGQIINDQQKEIAALKAWLSRYP